MPIRDRIKELRRIPASELRPNPKNWRTHPESQLNALRGILAEVGWADAVLARETPDGVQLIDGHARRDLDPETLVPVLVLDLNEEEADKLLAVLDPLAAMAGADADKLEALLVDVSTNSHALEELLSNLARQNGLLVDEDFGSKAAGKEFDESAADDLQMCECPKCGCRFPMQSTATR